MAGARVILDGIEIVHMLRTQQAKYASDGQLSLANRFERLCA
jgi:putative transposase